MANGDGVVTEADVRTAQALLDTIQDVTGAPVGHRTDARAALLGALADVRTAGYLEGLQRGRWQVAHVMLDALAGEGLFTTNTASRALAEEGW